MAERPPYRWPTFGAARRENEKKLVWPFVRQHPGIAPVNTPNVLNNPIQNGSAPAPSQAAFGLNLQAGQLNSILFPQQQPTNNPSLQNGLQQNSNVGQRPLQANVAPIRFTQSANAPSPQDPRQQNFNIGQRSANAPPGLTPFPQTTNGSLQNGIQQNSNIGQPNAPNGQPPLTNTLYHQIQSRYPPAQNQATFGHNLLGRLQNSVFSQTNAALWQNAGQQNVNIGQRSVNPPPGLTHPTYPQSANNPSLQNARQQNSNVGQRSVNASPGQPPLTFAQQLAASNAPFINNAKRNLTENAPSVSNAATFALPNQPTSMAASRNGHQPTVLSARVDAITAQNKSNQSQRPSTSGGQRNVSANANPPQSLVTPGRNSQANTLLQKAVRISQQITLTPRQQFTDPASLARREQTVPASSFASNIGEGQNTSSHASGRTRADNPVRNTAVRGGHAPQSRSPAGAIGGLQTPPFGRPEQHRHREQESQRPTGRPSGQNTAYRGGHALRGGHSHGPRGMHTSHFSCQLPPKRDQRAQTPERRAPTPVGRGKHTPPSGRPWDSPREALDREQPIEQQPQNAPRTALTEGNYIIGPDCYPLWSWSGRTARAAGDGNVIGITRRPNARDSESPESSTNVTLNLKQYYQLLNKAMGPEEKEVSKQDQATSPGYEPPKRAASPRSRQSSRPPERTPSPHRLSARMSRSPAISRASSISRSPRDSRTRAYERTPSPPQRAQPLRTPGGRGSRTSRMTPPPQSHGRTPRPPPRMSRIPARSPSPYRSPSLRESRPRAHHSGASPAGRSQSPGRRTPIRTPPPTSRAGARSRSPAYDTPATTSSPGSRGSQSVGVPAFKSSQRPLATMAARMSPHNRVTRNSGGRYQKKKDNRNKSSSESSEESTDYWEESSDSDSDGTSGGGKKKRRLNSTVLTKKQKANEEGRQMAFAAQEPSRMTAEGDMVVGRPALTRAQVASQRRERELLEKHRQVAIQRMLRSNYGNLKELRHINLEAFNLSFPTEKRCLHCNGRWFKVYYWRRSLNGPYRPALLCWSFPCNAVIDETTGERLHTQYGAPSIRQIEHGPADAWNYMQGVQLSDETRAIRAQYLTDLDQWRMSPGFNTIVDMARAVTPVAGQTSMATVAVLPGTRRDMKIEEERKELDKKLSHCGNKEVKPEVVIKGETLAEIEWQKDQKADVKEEQLKIKRLRVYSADDIGPPESIHTDEVREKAMKFFGGNEEVLKSYEEECTREENARADLQRRRELQDQRREARRQLAEQLRQRQEERARERRQRQEEAGQIELPEQKPSV